MVLSANPFVGRQREMGRSLLTTLRRAAEPRHAGRQATYRQDAHGTGAGSHRGAPGAQVLCGGCHEGDGAPPYWP